MRGKFKIAVIVLSVATLFQALVNAYVMGVEAGVNSLPTPDKIGELWVSYGLYTHPLRNVLSFTTLIIVVCWIPIAIEIVLRTERLSGYLQKSNHDND